MVGIILHCMHGFVISVLKGRELGYVVGSFDGTVYYVGGLCEGLGLGGIMNVSEIHAIQLDESSPISCK